MFGAKICLVVDNAMNVIQQARKFGVGDGAIIHLDAFFDPR